MAGLAIAGLSAGIYLGFDGKLTPPPVYASAPQDISTIDPTPTPWPPFGYQTIVVDGKVIRVIGGSSSIPGQTPDQSQEYPCITDAGWVIRGLTSNNILVAGKPTSSIYSPSQAPLPPCQ